MCMSIPKLVLSVDGDEAVVEGDAKVRLGDIRTFPGDYLLCYGNMAVEKVTKKKAEEFRKMLNASS